MSAGAAEEEVAAVVEAEKMAGIEVEEMADGVSEVSPEGCIWVDSAHRQNHSVVEEAWDVDVPWAPDSNLSFGSCSVKVASISCEEVAEYRVEAGTCRWASEVSLEPWAGQCVRTSCGVVIVAACHVEAVTILLGHAQDHLPRHPHHHRHRRHRPCS